VASQFLSLYNYLLAIKGLEGGRMKIGKLNKGEKKEKKEREEIISVLFSFVPTLPEG